MHKLFRKLKILHGYYFNIILITLNELYLYIIGAAFFQKKDVLIHRKLFIIEKLQINCVLCIYLQIFYNFFFYILLSFYQ